MTLSVLDKADLRSAIDLCVATFTPYVADPLDVPAYLKHASPKRSLALHRDGQLVGVYLGCEGNLRSRLRRFRCLNHASGLEGVALALVPELRGSGYGRLLRNAFVSAASRWGCDYVWGVALTSLENLDNWLTRRMPVMCGPKVNATVEPLSPELRTKLADQAPHLHERWRCEATSEQTTLSGEVVPEILGNGSRRPWLVSRGEAVALPSDAMAALADMVDGEVATVRGLRVGDRMTSVSAVPAVAIDPTAPARL